MPDRRRAVAELPGEREATVSGVLRGILVGLHALVSVTAVAGGAVPVVASLDSGFETT